MSFRREVFSSLGGGDDWKEAACKIIYSDKSIASVGLLVCNRVCVCTLQYVQTMRAWITLSVLWDKNSTFATGKALLQQKKEKKKEELGSRAIKLLLRQYGWGLKC